MLLGHDRDNDIIYVLAELKIKGVAPTIHVSRMRAIAGSVPAAYPHDGSGREKASGETLASIYKREGLAMLPTHATFAGGGYSAEAGIMETLTRMRNGRFRVAQNLREWAQKFEGHLQKDSLVVKANGDLLSATRVGAMQITSGRLAPLGPVRPEVRHPPRRGEFAIGHDADPFA